MTHTKTLTRRSVTAGMAAAVHLPSPLLDFAGGFKSDAQSDSSITRASLSVPCEISTVSRSKS